MAVKKQQLKRRQRKEKARAKQQAHFLIGLVYKSYLTWDKNKSGSEDCLGEGGGLGLLQQALGGVCGRSLAPVDSMIDTISFIF